MTRAQTPWSLHALSCTSEDAVLGRSGSLQVRLARSEAEVAAAQALRFQVFVREMGARASPSARAKELDSDEFDPICDHLLVFDTAVQGGAAARIVATHARCTLERAAR